MTASRKKSADCSEMLRWVAGLGAVTPDALAVRRACSIASARGQLMAAQRLGLLCRCRPLSGQPSLYTVTSRGLRAADMPGIKPMQVSAAGARHALACSRAAACLELTYPSLRVLGEPEIRLRERERGRPVFSVRVGGGGTGASMHRPDLVLVDPVREDALPIAVEVELTVKAPRRLAAICRAWARCSHMSGVLYVIAPEVRRALTTAIERELATERILQVGLKALEAGLDSPFERAVPSGT